MMIIPGLELEVLVSVPDFDMGNLNLNIILYYPKEKNVEFNLVQEHIRT